MRVLRVLTLNIWNRQESWEHRLELIRAGIRQLAPDLVGLQEVVEVDGQSQADALREGLGYEAAFGFVQEHAGGVRFGNAVLSRWPILESETLPLPMGVDKHDGPRGVLLARIASPFGTLPFFVTHLNWRFHHSHIRERQVVAIAEWVKDRALISGVPPVLVGDFNADPDASEMRFLRGLQSLEGKSTYFADSFLLTGEGRGVTFDAVRNPLAARTLEPPRRIDYVYVRGPDKTGRGMPLSARVVLDEVRDGIAASDHYGVLAEIAM